MKPTLAIRTHLGLGDMLVCNAIFRHYAQTHFLVIPCKQRNVPSVEFMLGDIEEKRIVPVGNGADGDQEADNVARAYKSIKLGNYGTKPFDSQRWDSEIYRQAGIPFEQRWDNFLFPEIPGKETGKPYIFVHDDASRGFRIDPRHFPEGVEVFRPNTEETPNLFSLLPKMRGAQEIHCIDSCFAILADSVGDLTDKIFFHWYARFDRPPHFRKNWEIIT